jgi:hypothetical protein
MQKKAVLFLFISILSLKLLGQENGLEYKLSFGLNSRNYWIVSNDLLFSYGLKAPLDLVAGVGIINSSTQGGWYYPNGQHFYHNSFDETITCFQIKIGIRGKLEITKNFALYAMPILSYVPIPLNSINVGTVEVSTTTNEAIGNSVGYDLKGDGKQAFGIGGEIGMLIRKGSFGFSISASFSSLDLLGNYRSTNYLGADLGSSLPEKGYKILSLGLSYYFGSKPQESKNAMPTF